MRNTRTELRFDCRKRKTHRAKRLPTSPKRKNNEYRTASGRRRASSLIEHRVWFGATEEVETEGGGREVVKKKEDIETGRDGVAIGREELDDAEAERVKGKEAAEEKEVLVAEAEEEVVIVTEE